MEKTIEKLEDKEKIINNPRLKESIRKKIEVLKGEKTVLK